MVEGYPAWLNNKWQQAREAMARNPELMSLLVALVLTGIVSHLDNPRGSRVTHITPLPPRIFGRDSPVVEFSTGDLVALGNRIGVSGAEVWIIMYYAHWDAYSLETAKEFEKAAQELSDQVLFMAVNCWYPFGICRNKVSVPYYPIIFAHRDSREGIQYTGLHHAQEIVEFLRHVCSPVTHIPDAESLMLYRAQHDTVALAYFSYEDTLSPRGLATYQWAAMLGLEKDPVQPTPFAVVTSKQLASALGFTHSMNFTLLRNSNRSLNYPSTEMFKARKIVNWVFAHRRSMVQWIAPPSLKSTMLSAQVFQMPTLILFTPHQYKNEFAEQFMLLREVEMQFYNCDNTSFVDKLIKIIQDERNRSSSKEDVPCSSSESCLDDLHSNETDCCQTLATRGRMDSISMAKGNVCEICETFSHPLPVANDPCSYLTTRASSPFLIEISDIVTASSNACLHVNNFYSPYSHYRLCCQDIARSDCDFCSPFQSAIHKHSLLRGPVTSYKSRTFSGSASHYTNYDSTEPLKRCSGTTVDSCDSECGSSRTNFESKVYREESPRTKVKNDFDEKINAEFDRLGCRTNRTLQFRAMRSEYFWPVAERLGLRPSLDKPEGASSGLAIVDIQNEVHHILHLDVTRLSPSLLKQFIINYTQSLLPRHMGSTIPPSHSTPDPTVRCSNSTGSVCLTEVTTETYDELVLNNDKDVLLLYHAPWCGMCLRIQHVILQLAAIFQSNHRLTIARIDADANDLHWHLLAPSYPTILFFPGRNKANSVKFPEETAVTLPNLIEFVLSHSQ